VGKSASAIFFTLANPIEPFYRDQGSGVRDQRSEIRDQGIGNRE